MAQPVLFIYLFGKTQFLSDMGLFLTTRKSYRYVWRFFKKILFGIRFDEPLPHDSLELITQILNMISSFGINGGGDNPISDRSFFCNDLNSLCCLPFKPNGFALWWSAQVHGRWMGKDIQDGSSDDVCTKRVLLVAWITGVDFHVVDRISGRITGRSFPMLERKPRENQSSEPNQMDQKHLGIVIVSKIFFKKDVIDVVYLICLCFQPYQPTAR